MTIDAGRLTELERVMGTDLREIVAGLLSTMTQSIAQIESAGTGGDLAALARAAHTCRNDALIVRASDLLVALEALEQSARYEDGPAAQTAIGQVLEAWPPVRSELERLVSP